MNIWIINHYATTEYFNKGGRPYSLSKYMKKAGNEVAVFCASTVHCTGDQLVEIKEGLFSEIVPESNVPHVFVKCRSYKGNGKKRILNMIDFYKNVERVALSYGNKNGKPDVIIGSSVHPLACIVAIKLAKRYGVKAVAEIRDLWPESLIAYGVVRANNPVVFFLRKLEKWIYKKSDAIIFTMEGAYNYILDRKWENSIPNSKVFFVNNGVDLIDFDSNLRKYQIDDNDLNNSDIHKVVYTGSVRKVNEVSILIEVAKKIHNKNIVFLIWGDGDERTNLEKKVISECVHNVLFKGRVEKKYIPYILSKADLNIAHNKPSSVLQYGVSFNKIFDYFAAGKPIICDFPSNSNPVIIHKAGIELKEATIENIANAIDEMFSSKSSMSYYAHNARATAEQCYNYEKLSSKMLSILNQVIGFNSK